MDNLTTKSSNISKEFENLNKVITSCKLEVITFDEVTSTNNIAKDLAKQGRNEGTIVIANKQTKGKGRMGRSFFSPENTGLYFSIILKPELPPEKALLITTAAAAATAKALSKYSNDIWIKWVNDIFLKDKKVCGILAESVLSTEALKLDSVILGIGVNLFSPEISFPKEISNIAGALNFPELTRFNLLSNILENFFEYYHSLPQITFFDTYREHMKLVGKKVRILPGPTDESNRIGLSGDVRYSNYPLGTITGLTPEFHLLVALADGTKKELSTGEIAL